MSALAFDQATIMAEVFGIVKASPAATTATLLQNGPKCSNVAIVAAPPASNSERDCSNVAIVAATGGANVIDLAQHFARAQRIADAKNSEAARRGETDRFCKCGDYAGRAWRIAGREIWLCDRCEGEPRS